MKYRILTLLILTTTVAVFFGTKAASSHVALILASVFASTSFACLSASELKTTPKKIILASSVSSFAVMVCFGYPLVIATAFEQLDLQITWSIADAFTSVFIMGSLVTVLLLLGFTLIYGGLAAFCGMILGVAATHIIYSWIRGKEIFK